jgi:hypothetical protein
MQKHTRFELHGCASTVLAARQDCLLDLGITFLLSLNTCGQLRLPG